MIKYINKFFFAINIENFKNSINHLNPKLYIKFKIVSIKEMFKISS